MRFCDIIGHFSSHLHKQNRRETRRWNFSFRSLFASWIQFHRQALKAAASWQRCGWSDLYLCCRMKSKIELLIEPKRWQIAVLSYLKHGSLRMSSCAPPSVFFFRILSIIQCKASLLMFLSNSMTMYDWREKWDRDMSKHFRSDGGKLNFYEKVLRRRQNARWLIKSSNTRSRKIKLTTTTREDIFSPQTTASHHLHSV